MCLAGRDKIEYMKMTREREGTLEVKGKRRRKKKKKKKKKTKKERRKEEKIKLCCR